MTATRKFQVSIQQLLYLKNATFLPAALIQIFEAAEPLTEMTWAVHLAADDAEQLRSAFTDHLAKVGFGANYELTNEGRILEDLIDRFYSHG